MIIGRWPWRGGVCRLLKKTLLAAATKRADKLRAKGKEVASWCPLRPRVPTSEGARSPERHELDVCHV